MTGIPSGSEKPEGYDSFAASAYSQLCGLPPDSGWIPDRTSAAQDIITQLLSKLRISERAEHERLVSAWPQIVGEFNARDSQPDKVVRGTLVVKVGNAPLRYSLESQKSVMLTRITALLGNKSRIHTIRFTQ